MVHWRSRQAAGEKGIGTPADDTVAGGTPAGTPDEDTDGAGLTTMLDRALAAQAPRAGARVAKLRRRHPADTPEQILRRLEKKYVRAVSGSGGTVGLVAAVPAVGTGTAVALTGGHVAAFLTASAGHVLAVADVYGVEVDDAARRRTLLLASLLGEDGARAVQNQLGLGSLYWGRAALTRLPIGTVRSVNKALTRKVVKAGAARGGTLALGRLVPFGVGAVVGWAGGRAMGRRVLAGTRTAFGPPPDRFGAGTAPEPG